MTTQLTPPKHRDLAIVFCCLVALVLAYHLGTALKGVAPARDQHLGTALHYAATRFDLQHTIIVGFNATDTPTIQEIPVWQMAAGLAFKLFGTRWLGWANVVSLLLFLNCLYPLFRIARQFYGDRAAWWSVNFFLCQALVFYYAGVAGTDGFCLSLALWFGFACCRMLEQPLKWFLPAAGLGTLLVLSKLPFFMATGLAAFFLLLKTRGFAWRELLALAGVGAVSGAAFIWWTHYTDALQAGAVYPFVDLRLSGSTNGMSMWFWYFGDMHYRLNPGNWLKAAWRLGSDVFGSFPLIAVFILAFASRRIHPAGKFFFAGALLTTAGFSHLILHHHHYLLLYSPAIALLGAAALAEAESILGRAGVSARLTTITAAAVLVAALVQGLMQFRAFSFDKFPATIVAAVRAHTSPEDKLVVINGGWGGDELFRAGRNGLSMWNTAAFENPEGYARLKKLGFNKLVILSESPFQNAVQIVNPGQTGIPRHMAKSWLTPQTEKWPTVLDTDDLIIKEIP
jgi:hypothetical protein